MTLIELIKSQPDLAELVAWRVYPAIANALNEPTVIANPVEAAPDVASDITLKAIMAQVPPAEGAKIFGLSGYVDNLRTAIDNDDRDYLGYLLQVALAAGAISAETAAKLAPMLTATTADPTWTATVAGPSLAAAAGLGVVTAADVQAAILGI
jgi:hypothetical protein